MFIISSTPGRLGNQVYQLLHVIYSSIIDKQQINIKMLSKLKFIFNLEKIEDNFNKCFETNNKVKKCHFFPRNLHLVNKRTIDLQKYFSISNTYIKPYLIDLPVLNADICLIHIRSGDQFINSKTHPSYVQPPFNYYTKIIDKYDNIYSKFIVLTEPDMLNPCIKLLKDYSSKVEIVSNKVEDDYKYLLRTQNLIISRSSFSDSIVFISKNLKNLYFWDYCHCLSDKSIISENINVESLSLTKPYIECGNWKNTKEQIKLMVNYKKEDIIFI
mgnify:CR=1 FL=1|jgi:hypothetical protein